MASGCDLIVIYKLAASFETRWFSSCFLAHKRQFELRHHDVQGNLQDSNDNGVRIVNFATSKNLIVKSENMYAVI
jgi:hypothetical protein